MSTRVVCFVSSSTTSRLSLRLMMTPSSFGTSLTWILAQQTIRTTKQGWERTMTVFLTRRLLLQLPEQSQTCLISVNSESSNLAHHRQLAEQQLLAPSLLLLQWLLQPPLLMTLLAHLRLSTREHMHPPLLTPPPLSLSRFPLHRPIPTLLVRVVKIEA